MGDTMAKYDCCECGACCCAGYDVLLNEEDVDRFESAPSLLRLTILHHRPGGWPMRFMAKAADGKRCVALDGPLGQVGCTIYDDRPGLCREFASGSPDCLEARRQFGLPI